jgi:hypothetical protein
VGEKTKVSVGHGKCVRVMCVQFLSLAMGLELQPHEVVLKIRHTNQVALCSVALRFFHYERGFRHSYYRITP